MKTIGMVGGMGPESTLDYYREIIRESREKYGSCPEIMIDSVNLWEMLELVHAQQWNELVGFLLVRIQRLRSAGAEFAFLSANTPHVVFDRLQELSPLPLVSIVEACRERAQQLGFRRVGLMGTGFTMSNAYYQNAFSGAGITIIVPKEPEKEYIERKLVDEIELGDFREETRLELLQIADRMARNDGIEALILGCTELPLILTEDKSDIPFLNTTRIHVERILKECFTK